MFILRINFGPAVRVLPSFRGVYNFSPVGYQLAHPYLRHGVDCFIGHPHFHFGYHTLPWGTYNSVHNPFNPFCHVHNNPFFTPLACAPNLYNPFNNGNFFSNAVSIAAGRILANQPIRILPGNPGPAVRIAFA